MLKQNLSTRLVFLYLQDSYSFILHTCMNRCSSYKRLEREINFSNKNCLLDTNMLIFDCVKSASVSMVTHSVYCMLSCVLPLKEALVSHNVDPCYLYSDHNSARYLHSIQVFSLYRPFCGHQHEAQMCIPVGSVLPSDTHVYVRILLLPYSW